MSSLAKYYRSAYRQEAVIPVEAPWHPDGATITLYVRPHHDSDFVAAREALGIPEPLTLEERVAAENTERTAKMRASAAKTRADLRTKGRKGGDVSGPVEGVATFLEQLAEEPSALPTAHEARSDGWDLRYPIYLPAEVGPLSEAIGDHLVDHVDVADADGEVTPWTKAQVAEAFSERSPIPAVLPDAPTDDVPFAGRPECEAWATVVLRDAVQEHRFLEREVPLDSASSDSGPSADTSEDSRIPPRALALA